MKLAEALSLRAALIQKANQLRSQLCSCVKVQEGDEPEESPEEVMTQLNSILGQVRDIVYRINMTNTATFVDGKNLTYWIAQRDMLSSRARAMKDALSTLNERPDRYSRSEIKYVRTVNVEDFRREYDHAASELRKLDLKIQEAGWLTDLVSSSDEIV